MASTKDKLRILENVIGRIGLGGDVLSEYSKALLAMSGLDTYAEMNPAPVPMPTQTQNSTPTPQMTPEMGQSTIPPQDGLNMP